MRIKLENVNTVLDTIHEKSSSRGLTLFLDYNMFNSYQNLLKEIAAESKYEEGEEILPSDLEKIKASVKGLIESAGNELSSKTVSRDDQPTYNSFPQMIALSDYLFATAMKELGCPDIRAHFGEDIEEDLKRTAKNVNKQIKSDVLSTVDGDEHYNAQRYKDANVVRGANSELISKCNNKSANSLELAQLTAEYQALHKRQEGHGAIWRLFHKSENIERKALLTEMKEAIQAMVGNVEISEKTPQEISDIADGKKIEKESVKPFKEDAIVNRNDLKWTSFIYEPKNSDRANAERERIANEQAARSNMNISSQDLENKGLDAHPEADERQKAIQAVKNISGLDQENAEAVVDEMMESFSELSNEAKEKPLTESSFLNCAMAPFEEAYNRLKQSGVSDKDAVIKAQNVVNHLISNLAPNELFSIQDVEKYSNDCIVKNEVALKVSLGDDYKEEDFIKLQKDLKAEYSKERLNLSGINEENDKEKSPVVIENKDLEVNIIKE